MCSAVMHDHPLHLPWSNQVQITLRKSSILWIHTICSSFLCSFFCHLHTWSALHCKYYYITFGYVTVWDFRMRCQNYCIIYCKGQLVDLLLIFNMSMHHICVQLTLNFPLSNLCWNMLLPLAAKPQMMHFYTIQLQGFSMRSFQSLVIHMDWKHVSFFSSKGIYICLPFYVH